MANKDSLDAEDKYFLKRDMEKMEGHRHELDIKRREEDKKKRSETHWMKCPKCGSGLEEVNQSNVMMDQCPECGGIWLDKGELELLTQGQSEVSKSFFGRLFK
ncbi:MAG: zf-TFIIB domain-containing protein [Desulfobacterales bacterium]